MVVCESKLLLPADILLLSSSEAKGICYSLKTANLTCETNLKGAGRLLPATARADSAASAGGSAGPLISAEPPNDDTKPSQGSVLLHCKAAPRALGSAWQSASISC
uniref:Uncharacterized protein n=1 Tax=Macrostomum lignano TaxID=282301 RepID=A0A1I8F8G3_9PLAT